MKADSKNREKKQIYFCGSVTGGRELQARYEKLIAFLETKGTVLTKHLGSKELSSRGENLPDQAVFERDMRFLEKAGLVVAEVSVPSSGVGYEIAIAEKQGKQVIGLYNRKTAKRLSRIIGGNPRVRMIFYETVEEAIRELEKLLK